MNKKILSLLSLFILSGSLNYSLDAQHWSLTMKNIMLNAPDMEEAGSFMSLRT